MNITASTAFRYILLKSFCIIIITHVYLMGSNSRKVQDIILMGFFCYKDVVVKAIFTLNYYSNCLYINFYINLCI